MKIWPELKIHINDTVDFNVHPTAVLGSGFQRVKLLAVLDIDTASVYIDPHAMHATVYPTLPSGTPNDPSQYSYLKVQMPNGTKQVLGIPWINEGSVTKISGSRIVITIEDVSSDDLLPIKNALTANGYATAKVDLTE